MQNAPAATLSEAEQRFDALRRGVGLLLGPVALAVVLVWPMPGLPEQAHTLAAIVTLVVVWWVTEAIPIPMTALAGTALAVVLGVADTAEAFAPFADPLIFLFIGSFILSRAVVEHGLDRRIATALLSLPAIGSSFARTRVAVGFITIMLSAWMSNMVVTAMMLPIVLGVLHAQADGRARESRWSTNLLLVVAYSAAIGGIITPVGAAPNLITIGLLDSIAGVKLGFFTWVAVALPISLVMAALLFLAASRCMPVGGSPAALPANPDTARALWTKGQRNAAAAFVAAVLLWMMPSLLGIIAAEATLTKWVTARVTEPVAAIMAATLLFVLPLDWSRRRFTLGWTQAAQIDWGTILLLGGGFSLGRLMFRTGLAERVANRLIDVSGAESLWAITAMVTAVAVLITELTSNTATTNMLVPVVISICSVAGVSPVAPAIGTCLGASLAFMLPISTPSNAIVYGTGLVPIRSMIGFGIIMDVLGYVVILVGLRILCPLLGLT
ncbi:MAG: DASS family sodium-coupled anion symporter [Acidobacteria bacterium]|nr:DASS family sodium-coupled anion symporter [Acidobacteriota bacterium]